MLLPRCRRDAAAVRRRGAATASRAERSLPGRAGGRRRRPRIPASPAGRRPSSGPCDRLRLDLGHRGPALRSPSPWRGYRCAHRAPWGRRIARPVRLPPPPVAAGAPASGAGSWAGSRPGMRRISDGPGLRPRRRPCRRPAGSRPHSAVPSSGRPVSASPSPVIRSSCPSSSRRRALPRLVLARIAGRIGRALHAGAGILRGRGGRARRQEARDGQADQRLHV